MQLKDLIARSEAKSVNVRVLREGKELLLPIRVVSQGALSSIDKSERKNMIGVMISEDYDLPFEVKINLKNIGGPSAGLIFALSIIDKLTREDLVKGRNVAGTGTISPDGKVGPIGGIEEKLIGAAREGSTLFLAPSLNCPEIRHIPQGLQVVPVDTLTEALAALRETDPERLPMCG
jgi:PDZ domain-containing protein